MPRVPRLGLLVSLLAMVAVGAAGAIAAQAATGPAAGTAAGTAASAVSPADADCACDEDTGLCPAPSLVPSPTASVPAPPTPSAPASPPPLTPSFPASPGLPTYTLSPFPSTGPVLRLASANRVAAPTLKFVIDVDMTGMKNGESVRTNREEPKPARFKVLCPKRLEVNALYTNNPFQGQLLSIEFIDPGFFPEDCWVTIKVLDPESGRVLETYESPSDMILIKQDAIGFKHRPARIRVEVTCDE